jgi:Family of unknown function (DUF6262)
MTDPLEVRTAAERRRPSSAIASRRRDAVAKVAAVKRAVTTLGRTGAPMTRAGVANLAGVSRSFTYQNATADTLITAAQTTSSQSRARRVEVITAQQEASWRERALNAEDQVSSLRRELTKQRQLIATLLGQLRDPDGTWLQQDRDRLRDDNERLLQERNQLLIQRNDLHRNLAAARANISRLNQGRAAAMFPHGPDRRPDRS